MKEYVCTVCGYVHKGELSEGFVCPVCGAGVDAFKEVVKERAPKANAPKKKLKAPETEFSAIEMSVICSNLARGAEKQYMPEEQKRFETLAKFFLEEAAGQTNVADKNIGEMLDKDLSELYPAANESAAEASDRGAKRSLVWSEKVTTALKSVIARYGADGAKIPDDQSVYVCSVCGFVFVGKEPPAICPVCKVPAWKFEKSERRAK